MVLGVPREGKDRQDRPRDADLVRVIIRPVAAKWRNRREKPQNPKPKQGTFFPFPSLVLGLGFLFWVWRCGVFPFSLLSSTPETKV